MTTENWFRHKDERGRETEIKIPSSDPMAIASFREFMLAIQENQQQDWSNQMQAISVRQAPNSQLALPQSQPLQLAAAQPVPAPASFPRHPEPIYQPSSYETYADLEVSPYQQPHPQPVHQPSPQATTYQQPATVLNPYQDLYQLEPLLDDGEMEEIFNRPLWLRLLINPLSLSLSLSLVLGGITWFAIDAFKNSAAPKPTPAPAAQVAPAPVAPASPQPQQSAPKAVMPKTGNQLQVAPSAPPPPPNS
jgi:hypothetical protein